MNEPDILDTFAGGGEREPARLRLLAVVAVLGVALGVVIGVAFVRPRDNPESRVAAGDGQIVYVCGRQAVVALLAHRLAGASDVEVLLPLRGDGVLLPVTIGGANVLVGALVGHQYFRASHGDLALVVQVRPPPSTQVSLPARVGNRQLTMPVQRCPDDG